MIGASLMGGRCGPDHSRRSQSHPGAPHPDFAVAFALLYASQSPKSTGAAPW